VIRRNADEFPMSAQGVAQLPVDLEARRTFRPSLVPAPVDGASTADVLGRLGPRWSRLDNIPFGATVEIGHVLLATAGVFVVETARSTTEWTLSSPELLHAVSETRWRARKIASLLRRIGRPCVTPMLVVSGPGAPAIAGGYQMVDGVLVARGDEVACWSAYLDELPPIVESVCVGEMIDVLLDHTLRTDEINRVPARRHVTPSA